MSVKLNLFSNYLGNIYSAAISIAFIPLYINRLGIESYALIGVYGTLVSLSSILDLGFSSTINREIALYKHDIKNYSKINNIVRTFELIYWAIAIVLFLSIFFSSHYISQSWLKSESIQTEIVYKSILLMAFILAVQWPQSLYNGALYGFEKHTTVNIFLVVFTTIRNFGVVFILYYFCNTIICFFWWMAFTSLLQTLFLYLSVRKDINKHLLIFKTKLVFNKETFAFLGGISIVTVLSVIGTQIDKVFLSKYLTLVEYGYYIFAVSVAGKLNMIAKPFFTTFYPRFTALIAQNRRSDLLSIYLKSSHIMAAILLPFAIFLVFFSNKLLLIWTKNESLINNSDLIFKISVVIFILNAIQLLPYALALSSKKLKPFLIGSIVTNAVSVPLIWFLASRGGNSAIYVILFLLLSNIISFFLYPILIHKIIFGSGVNFKWYNTVITKITVPSIITIYFYMYILELFNLANNIFFILPGLLLAYFTVLLTSKDFKIFILTFSLKNIITGK